MAVEYSLVEDARALGAGSGVAIWAATDDYLVGGFSGREEGAEEVEVRHCLGFSNRARLVSVDGQAPQRVGADVVRFHNVGEHLASRDLGQGLHSGTWIALSPEFAEGLARGRPTGAFGPFGRNFIAPSPGVLFRVRRFFRRAREFGDGPWLAESISDIADALLEGDEPQASCSARQRALARRADEHLAQQFAGAVNLPRIARTLNVSPSYLARTYRAATGRRLYQQVSRMRVAAALAQLTEGARDLADLAFDLGYSSHSHFTADFRRLTGAPPSAFLRGSEI